MKISVQSQNLVDEIGMEQAYRAIREAGFDAIDWNLDHAWDFAKVKESKDFTGLSIFERPLKEILAHYEEELSIIRKNGLAITQAHAPFGAYDEQNPRVLDYAIEIYKNIIRFCEAWDVRVWSFTAFRCRNPSRLMQTQQIMSCSTKSSMNRSFPPCKRSMA